MARFSIYSSSGKLKYTGYPKYVGAYLDVPYLEFATIESPYPINWERGDYVIYSRTGLKYKLYSTPLPKKQAASGKYGAAFVYSNVKFYSAVKDLEIAPFRDVVSNDNRIHFSTRQEVNTFEDVYGIATRIQENMNDIFPGTWEIRVVKTDDKDLLALISEKKEFSVSGSSCLDALMHIYETWKNVGWTHTYENGKDVITIGSTSLRNESNTTSAYAYGKNNGLTSIKKMAANENEFATRLYVYGSERNIQTRYYNGLNIYNNESVDIRNLMLPTRVWGKTDSLPDARKSYIQASADIVQKYGLIPRTVYFDGGENEEIYPSITGLTEGKVRAAMIDAGQSSSPLLPPNTEGRIDEVLSCLFTDDDGTKQDIEANGKWTLWVRGVGFNIADQGKLTEEGYATISMKGGACAGREFKVLSSRVVDYAQELTLERTWDESLGMGFPNGIYPVEAGDQFVLLDIPMPDYYITLAEERLLEAGVKMLEDYTRVSAYYEPVIDPIVVANGNFVLREGMYMQIYDNDIVDTEDNNDYVLIDTITIEERGELPSYRVTLREQKRSARTFGTLEEMIDDTKRETSEKINKQREYTERRFRSAQETINMLQGAFSNFSEGISPITVKTMSLLVGDESLQFRFVTSTGSTTPKASTLRYVTESKRLVSSGDSIQHMTLGIDAVAPSHQNYFYWQISPADITLPDANKAYFIYIKATKNEGYGGVGEYIVSETAIEMEAVSGYYHFLTAIINSERDGNRSLAFLNGFTEVLPGQITTPVISDSEGKLVIDLENATISAKDGAKIIGDVEFSSDSTGLENLQVWKDLENNLSGVAETLEQLQDQIDGVVENYFLEGDPSVNKAPVTDWTTDEDKFNHVGDTYTNIEEFVDETTTPNAGKSWRWCECGSYPIETEATTSVTINSTPSVQKIGNVPIKDYGSAILYRNGSPLAYFHDFDYDKEIGVSSGPPCRIRVESTTGDVYLDNYAGSISAIIVIVFNVGVVMALKNGGTRVMLHWHPIADTDATKALEMAARAQATADGKRRVFTEKPYPPYDKGDLWVQGESGDMLVCVNPKTAIESFSDLDWEKASKYTDDTKANEVLSKLNQSVDDLNQSISDAESAMRGYTDEAKSNLEKTIDDINTTKANIADVYTKAEADGKIDAKEQAILKQAEEVAKTQAALLDIQVKAYADGEISKAEADAIAEAQKRVDAAKADLEKAIALNVKNLLPNSSTIKNYMLPLADYPDGGSSTYYAKILLPIKVNGGETYTFKCENAQKLSGSQAGYRIRIDDGTRGEAGVTNVFSNWATLAFGDNQTATLTISSGVVDRVAFLTIVRQSASGNSRSDSILLNNVSLVRGTTPLSVWEDYNGDAGLNNLLLIPEEVRDSSYNASWFYVENLPFTVKGGETYAISVDNLEKTGGTKEDCFAVLCPQDSSEWLTNAVYISFKRKTWGILRIKDDVVSSTARLMIGKGEADNNLKLNITRISLVRGPLPLMEWKESRALFNKLSESIKDAQSAIDAANRQIDALGVSNEQIASELNAQKGKVEQAQKDLTDIYDKATGDGYISDAEKRAIKDAEDKLKAATEALEEMIDNLATSIENDYGYLRTAFGQITAGDVFLSKLMGVGTRKGEKDFTVNAFMNGSSEISGTAEEGKLMIATGIPATGGTLAQRAAQATTRIYEKGKIVTNSLIAKGDVEIGGAVRFTPVKLQDALTSNGIQSSYSIGSKPPTYLAFSGSEHQGIGSVVLQFTNAVERGRTIEIFCEPLINKNDATLLLTGTTFFLPTASTPGTLATTTTNIQINGGKIELYYSLDGNWIVTSPITSNITIA